MIISILVLPPLEKTSFFRVDGKKLEFFPDNGKIWTGKNTRKVAGQTGKNYGKKLWYFPDNGIKHGMGAPVFSG